MKNYIYACFELNVQLKNNMVAEVKIPFDTEPQAMEYIYSHISSGLYSKAWIE